MCFFLSSSSFCHVFLCRMFFVLFFFRFNTWVFKYDRWNQTTIGVILFWQCENISYLKYRRSRCCLQCNVKKKKKKKNRLHYSIYFRPQEVPGDCKTFCRELFGWVALGRTAVCDCGTPWTFLLPFLPRRVSRSFHFVTLNTRSFGDVIYRVMSRVFNIKITGSIADSSGYHIPPKPEYDLGPWNHYENMPIQIC